MTDTATPGALDLVKLRELAADPSMRAFHRLYPRVTFDPQTVMALCDEVERLRAGIAPLYHPRDDEHTCMRRCLICGRMSRIVALGEPAIVHHEPDCVLATPTAEPAVPVETEARFPPMDHLACNHADDKWNCRPLAAAPSSEPERPATEGEAGRG